MGRVQALLSTFHDDGEPKLGRTQVPGLGGLAYHHFRVDIMGGVRAKGDYYGDSSVHFPVTPGTSTACTSTRTTLATCTGYSIDALQSWRGSGGGGSPRYT